jgi:hypothetical protein
VTASVEDAVRRAIRPGGPAGDSNRAGQFIVAEYAGYGIVLLPGEKQARTPLPWQALEQVLDFPRGGAGS